MRHDGRVFTLPRARRRNTYTPHYLSVNTVERSFDIPFGRGANEPFLKACCATQEEARICFYTLRNLILL